MKLNLDHKTYITRLNHINNYIKNKNITIKEIDYITDKSVLYGDLYLFYVAIQLIHLLELSDEEFSRFNIKFELMIKEFTHNYQVLLIMLTNFKQNQIFSLTNDKIEVIDSFIKNGITSIKKLENLSLLTMEDYNDINELFISTVNLLNNSNSIKKFKA